MGLTVLGRKEKQCERGMAIWSGCVRNTVESHLTFGLIQLCWGKATLTDSLSLFLFLSHSLSNSICEGFFFQATQCRPFQLIRFCNHLRLSSSNIKQNIKVRFKSCVRKRRHLFPNMRWKIALYITQIIVDKRKIQWYTKSGQNYRNNKDIRRCLFFSEMMEEKMSL